MGRRRTPGGSSPRYQTSELPILSFEAISPETLPITIQSTVVRLVRLQKEGWNTQGRALHSESMQLNRRIQLGAAVVIANGFLALAAVASRPALAASCADQTAACGCTQYSLNNGGTTECDNETPPGCTFVSATCTTTLCFRLPNGEPVTNAICHYN
jgi:hypothetical protein